MRLSETDRLLLDRGWSFHGNSLWCVEIGGNFIGYNTEKGLLTTQEGYINNDVSLPNLKQRYTDITTVLSLGFADDWHEKEPRLNRERMKLDSLFHL